VVLLVEGDYSLKVLDSSGVQIYYVPSTAYEQYLIAGNYYYPDYAEADQGVVGGGETVTDILAEVGAVTEATMYFSHNSGAATTTYTFTTNTTITDNFSLIIEDGVLLDGAGILTPNCSIEAGPYVIFPATSPVVLTNALVDKINIKWFAGDDEVAFEAALTASNFTIPVYFPPDDYDFNDNADMALENILMVGDSRETTTIDNVGRLISHDTGDASIIDISGLTFNSSTGPVRIYSRDVARLWVKDCKFTDCTAPIYTTEAFFATYGDLTPTVSNVSITNNIFQNTGAIASATSITMATAKLLENVLIDGNTFTDIVDTGGIARTVTLGEEAANLRNPTIPVSGNGIVVTNNVFDGCGDSTVLASAPANTTQNLMVKSLGATIANNSFRGGLNAGGVYTKGSYINIDGNTFHNIPQGFIQCGPVAEYGGSTTMNEQRIISNNAGYNAASMVEYFYQARLMGSGVISNNSFEGNATGLYVEPATSQTDCDIVISGNKIRTRYATTGDEAYGIGIQAISPIRKLTITDNIIECDDDRAIVAFYNGEESGELIMTGNNMTSGADSNTAYDIWDYVTLANNKITCKFGFGILGANKSLKLSNNEWMFGTDIGLTTVSYGIQFYSPDTGTGSVSIIGDRFNTTDLINSYITASANGATSFDSFTVSNCEFAGTIGYNAIDIREGIATLLIDTNVFGALIPAAITFTAIAVTTSKISDNVIHGVTGVTKGNATIRDSFIVDNLFTGTTFLSGAWTGVTNETEDGNQAW